MEVIDDMKLGKLVKMAGFRSGIAVAQRYVSVQWHVGLGNLVRGVEKNFFAAAQFQLSTAAAQILALLVMNVLPFVGLFLGHGWIRAFAAISVLIATCFHLGVDVVMRISPLYCLTLPLGAIIVSYMILRSTIITLRQGGIVWRDTFYPLDELRRGLV
jgi:uncharacterized membrane protein (DUF2068 family)